MFSIDLERFHKALVISGHDPALGARELTEETRDFLNEFRASESLFDFLEKSSYISAKKIGNVHFDAVNNLAKNNLVPENKRCVDNGLLIIGHGLNGDPIVIDVESFEVGYVFHDELWEGVKDDIRSMVVRMNRSVGDFFESVASVPNFPIDAFEAEEYVKRSSIAEIGGNASE